MIYISSLRVRASTGPPSLGCSVWTLKWAFQSEHFKSDTWSSRSVTDGSWTRQDHFTWSVTDNLVYRLHCNASPMCHQWDVVELLRYWSRSQVVSHCCLYNTDLFHSTFLSMIFFLFNVSLSHKSNFFLTFPHTHFVPILATLGHCNKVGTHHWHTA